MLSKEQKYEKYCLGKPVMKIAYSITNIGNSGGIERVLSSKANYLADVFGYEIHIIVGGEQPDSLFYPFSEKIRFHYLNINFRKKALLDYLFESQQEKIYRQRLSQQLNVIQPDITISMFGGDAEFLYKIKDGSVKVLEFHFTKNYLTHLGNALPGDKFRWLRKCWLLFLKNREKNIAKKYDHIVLLTQKDKILWGNKPKFEVIPNPLSFITEKTAELENKIIVSMGRLVYPKGFQYLIRAFALLKENYPDWKVNIYGNGHDKELLQKEINALSLQEHIFLKEPVQEVESVLLESSLFVLPSLYDGFGLVLTEAMTSGVPCVSFDCECGPSEIITDNTDGLLVETGNIRLLAKKMELLMQHKKLRVEMGGKAKKNVERYSVPAIMNKWKDYFSQIM